MAEQEAETAANSPEQAPALNQLKSDKTSKNILGNFFGKPATKTMDSDKDLK